MTGFPPRIMTRAEYREMLLALADDLEASGKYGEALAVRRRASLVPVKFAH